MFLLFVFDSAVGSVVAVVEFAAVLLLFGSVEFAVLLVRFVWLGQFELGLIILERIKE